MQEYYGTDSSKKLYSKVDGCKYQTWNARFVQCQQGLVSIRVHGRHQIAGKEHNLEPMWKRSMTVGELEKPTIFLDQLYLGRHFNANSNRTTVTSTSTKMFAPRISAGAIEKVAKFRNSERKCRRVVLRHDGPGCERSGANATEWFLPFGKTCEEMRGTVLRIQASISYLWSPHRASMITSSRGRSWKRWEN